MSHDHIRQGSRTLAKLRIGPIAVWAEESASWHYNRTAHFGVVVATAPEISTATVSLGRWSLVLAWNLGKATA